MGRSRRLAIPAFLLLLSGSVFGQEALSTLKTGTPPTWVEWTNPEGKTAIKADHDSGGQVYTFIDTQVNEATTETLIHVVEEITTDAGVQSGANLQFTWDPSYQEITFHQITIQRGTERINHLDTNKFKIIQQETDLNRHIYNGAVSALRFLEDVRVGDRIEYAYTLRGENPSLKGRWSNTFMLGYGVRVAHRRIRVLWPQERTLNYQVHGMIAEPEVHIRGRNKEYVWDLHDVPSVAVEDQLPSWALPYPWIQLSEFKDWSEVATWAAGLFVTTNLDAPEIKEEIANLHRLAVTPEQTVDAALEFTQTKIRYLGIEFGPNSYHPTDPVTVLRRRFGDCKDKAFLLCTLLQGLGYDATPVLVATGFRHTLPDLLPAPHDFNHVIVRVVDSKKTFWLDPTCLYQRNPLTQRYRPDYAFGLLARPGEQELTPIPRCQGGMPETFTSEVFRVGGQKAATQLTVTSTFEGYDAEWMRSYLASSGGRENLAKSYLNDYAQRYPGITSTAPVVINDSEFTDRLTVAQNYTITNFWTLSTDKQVYNCQFYPLGIHTWITKPKTAVRSMPMELSFPRRRSIQTKIELPDIFKLTNLTNTIAGPAAELRIKRAFQGRTLWLNYEYRSLTNFVPVSLTTSHLNSLDQMENALGYSLNWQSMDGIGNSSQFNWPICLLAVIYSAMFATGLGFLCRHQCRLVTAAAQSQPPVQDREFSGLGGWLILVGIALVIGPVQTIVAMIRSLGSFSLWKWHAMTSPGGASYHPAWGPLLTIEFLCLITLLILNLVLLVLFFQQRRIFPRWFIAFMVFSVIYAAGDMIGMEIIKTLAPQVMPSRNLVQVVIRCIIWIPYMFISRRVKATFVR